MFQLLFSFSFFVFNLSSSIIFLSVPTLSTVDAHVKGDVRHGKEQVRQPHLNPLDMATSQRLKKLRQTKK